jgi:stearoyl-CoA desaturase (delta-9 desaturase)
MNLPWKNIHWKNSAFLIGTFLMTVIGVPAYIWHFGLDGFQIGLFLFLTAVTGISITLGYHRLFSHLTFHAKWPVKVFTVGLPIIAGITSLQITTMIPMT